MTQGSARPQLIRRQDFQVCFDIDKRMQIYYVYERMGLREFLLEATTLFDVWLFPASRNITQTPSFKKIDPDDSMFSKRFYRENCV